MIRVYVKKYGKYAINTPKLKKRLVEYLTNGGIVSDADVSVSIVGEKRMIALARKYLKENNVLHDVLSFPFIEGNENFIQPPDEVIHLGEIVICYPKVVESAKMESKMIDDKAIEFVEHAASHLLGKHHP